MLNINKIIILNLLLPLSLIGQQVELSIIPASTYDLSHRDEWALQVQNNSNASVSAYFVGTATEKKRGLVFKIRSAVLVLAPGLTQFSTSYYLGLDPYVVEYEDAVLKKNAVALNGLPAGEYEMCIVALDAQTSVEVASTCYSFDVNDCTPPELMLPAYSEFVTEEFPYFLWMPSVPPPSGNFAYTLRIFEIQNKQTPTSAVQTNPAFYEMKGIQSAYFQYGLNARNFVPGKSYSWKVDVVSNDLAICGSDVSVFHIPVDTIVTAIPEQTASRNSPLPGVPYMPTAIDGGSQVSSADRGFVSFSYEHDISSSSAGIRILNSTGLPIYNEVLELETGMNYFTFQASDLKAIKPGDIYEIQIINSLGVIKSVRFKLVNK